MLIIHVPCLLQRFTTGYLGEIYILEREVTFFDFVTFLCGIYEHYTSLVLIYSCFWILNYCCIGNFSCCSGTKLEIEWSKPKCYGDAHLDRYLLRLDGSNYVDINNDSNSYIFTSVEGGSSFRFELQVSVTFVLNNFFFPFSDNIMKVLSGY